MKKFRPQRKTWKVLALFALSLVACSGAVFAQEEVSLQFSTALPVAALRNLPAAENSIATNNPSPTALPFEAVVSNPTATGVEENDLP